MEPPEGIPTGFGGCVDTIADLLPEGRRVLRLPDGGVVDGPFVRIPDEIFDVILVRGLSESLGCLERFVDSASGHLADDGLLLIDMENLAAPRSLKYALEGRPGNTDPYGSIREPERREHWARVVQALDGAELLLEDIYLVPSRTSAVGPQFLRTILREGFVALPYVDGAPPARVWLQARKRTPWAGSVLIAGGASADAERTAAQLHGFLPDGWEVLQCDVGPESEAFNKALPRTRGEVLWFLRAGTTVDAELFRGLWARTVISPAAPGVSGTIAHCGDVNGLMARRADVFCVGPFSRSYESQQVVFEDWLLRLEAGGKRTEPIDGGFEYVAPPRPEVETFAAESEHLIAKWNGLEPDQTGFPSHDNPHCREHPNRAVPWAGRRPRLSLCMITKDEERFLGECLASAVGIVDEIVVVDTGSVDRTREIARGYGARVIEHEWQDDFAAARNVALRAATGDWILSLDADETLRTEQHDLLRKSIEDPGVSGYHLRFKNHHTEAKTAGVVMIRLFRNLEGLEWENRIHEQISSSLLELGGVDGLQLSISEATVDHFGYLDEVMESRNKGDRNDRLFKAHLAEKPDDIYMLYKYGDFLRRTTSRWDESLTMLKRAFDLICAMPPSRRVELPYASEIAALMALEHRRAGEDGEAAAIIETALREFVCTPNLHYLAAGLAVLRGDSDEAIRHYRRCLAYRDQVLVVPIQEGITSYVSIAGIAHAYLQKGQINRAERLLRQSLEIEPSYEVAVLLLSRVGLEQRDPQKALRVLLDHLKKYPDAPGVCQQAALLMKELGLSQEAEGMANTAISLLENQSLESEAKQLKEAFFATA